MTDTDAVSAQLARWREVAVEAREHSARGVAATGEALDALPLLLDALEAAMGALEFYADVDSWRGDGYPLYEETGTAQRALIAIAATLEGSRE